MAAAFLSLCFIFGCTSEGELYSDSGVEFTCPGGWRLATGPEAGLTFKTGKGVVCGLEKPDKSDWKGHFVVSWVDFPLELYRDLDLDTLIQESWKTELEGYGEVIDSPDQLKITDSSFAGHPAKDSHANIPIRGNVYATRHMVFNCNDKLVNVRFYTSIENYESLAPGFREITETFKCL